MDAKVKLMIKLTQEDVDSFTRRADDVLQETF